MLGVIIQRFGVQMAEAIEIRRLVDDECAEADLLWLQCFERGYLNRLEVLPEYRIGLEHRITRFGLWDQLGMQWTAQMYDAPPASNPDQSVLLVRPRK